ncbi:hypothetical protein DPMN_169221 [Dreissena polymorpha]|uniref:Uncharacterized protein n=1 Tax=Dreissena polymorpha TaxID=45954 RepID=A0A9D4F829_DREPO|nr:hypothetical protein DPMN_169221 [Dreissena polymorpha]
MTCFHILETPVEVTFKVTADDLFKNVTDDTMIRNKPKTIRLVCQDPSTNTMQSQDIPLCFKSGYLIVQTDKPLFNTEEKGIA